MDERNADLEALEAAAKAATPGKWWANIHWQIFTEEDQLAKNELAGCLKEEDAIFIALANPATILALCRELRERRRGEEIQMRRGWTTDKSPLEGEGWRVMTWGDYFAFTDDGHANAYGREQAEFPIPHWPTPTAALIAADEWLTQRPTIQALD